MNLEYIIDKLAQAPGKFEASLQSFSQNQLNWKPESWEGIPSEEFSALEQICHLRDIEIDGYQVRFQRIVNEDHPTLVSLDGYQIAEKYDYRSQIIETVLAEFGQARQQTIELIKSFSETDLTRKGFFEGTGEVTLKSMIYFLRSHDLQHLSGMNWLLGKLSA
jgi:hypothetical protein